MLIRLEPWHGMAYCSWNIQDYLQQPPAQELVARDLHDQEWHFRHIYRGEKCLKFFLWTSVGESDLQLDTCYCRFFSSYFMKSPIGATISTVLSCVEQANPAGIYSLLGGVYLSIIRDCKRVTLFCSYGNKNASSHLMFCNNLHASIVLLLSWPHSDYWLQIQGWRRPVIVGN